MFDIRNSSFGFLSSFVIRHSYREYYHVASTIEAVNTTKYHQPAQLLAAPDKPAPTLSSPLDINKASADELTALPGIGPVMAQRIVEFREEHGPFRRVEDLLKVKGIGEKSFEKLRPSIKVSESK